jgi:hypothetical protein
VNKFVQKPCVSRELVFCRLSLHYNLCCKFFNQDVDVEREIESQMRMYILLVILQAMKTQILFICNYDGKISIFVLIGFDHLQVGRT